jgi:small ligand-binding sensory domain FIST
MRICAEIREELEPEEMPLPVAAALAVPEAQAAPSAARRIAGAVYVSCAGRGGPHFGGPSAEMQIVRHALGDVPLVGFFAGGEIARHHLYGYTGVLTVFR